MSSSEDVTDKNIIGTRKTASQLPHDDSSSSVEPAATQKTAAKHPHDESSSSVEPVAVKRTKTVDFASGGVGSSSEGGGAAGSGNGNEKRGYESVFSQSSDELRSSPPHVSRGQDQDDVKMMVCDATWTGTDWHFAVLCNNDEVAYIVPSRDVNGFSMYREVTRVLPEDTMMLRPQHGSLLVGRTLVRAPFLRDERLWTLHQPKPPATISSALHDEPIIAP